MSTATVSGADAVKQPGVHQNGPKQQFKPTNTNAKALEGPRKPASPQPEAQNRKSQQNAWQGRNPITQRSSNPVQNGADKPLPTLPQQTPNLKRSEEGHSDKHANDRTTYLMAHFIGKDATITLKSGEAFTGVFSGGVFDSNISQYRMKMVRREKTSAEQANGIAHQPDLEFVGEGEDHAMTFDIQDTRDLAVLDVSMGTATTQQNGSRGPSFLTDTQISSRDSQRLAQRELQRWEPGPETLTDLSLEDSGATGWDQFAANEKMYGVHSTYDEDIYTTSINRKDPDYKRRQAEADRIAREIEGSAPANAHVAEERRRDADRDEGGDEEDKYSGVRREAVLLPKRAAGAYVPPSQRPLTSTPSVPGAPFDPAIISSQVSKQDPVPAPVPSPIPVAAAEQAAPTPAATIAAEPPKESPTQDEQSTSAAAPSTPKEASTVTGNVAQDVRDAFKQFANTEKLKLRQAREAKLSHNRAEKNVKINDLKKFAANFKLTSRVPDDLVPILAKDREKQMEIQTKAEEAAKEQEQRVKEKGSAKASPVPSSTATTAAPNTPVTESRGFQTYNRGSQRGRGGGHLAGQGQSRASATSRPQNASYQQQHAFNQASFPGQPKDLRIPSNAVAAVDAPMSPLSATRLNINAKAFEFRPGASSFAPSGASPSPQRIAKAADPPAAPFFDEDASKATVKEARMDTVERLVNGEYEENQKKHFKANGGCPQSYSTPPTWSNTKANDNISYLNFFPKAQSAPRGSSPMHAPNSTGHMQPVPVGMHGMHFAAPGGRHQFYPQPQGGHPGAYGHMPPQFSPGMPVQNSPRQQPMAVAPFNGQMPQMAFPNQPMPGYGMSPSMQYRQLPIANGQMMLPGQQGQMGGQIRPGYPQYPGPTLGGPMMVPQPSGGYPNGPMPQQGYPQMPPHASPHMQHPGYAGSPRPPMMSHQGSHQGYTPAPHMQPQYSMQGQPGGYPTHFQRVPSNGHGHGFQQQPMGTPRSHHPMPAPYQQSPGAPAGNSGPTQGDDGK